MVPVDTLAFIIAHAGEEHTAGLGLPNDVLNNLGAPVIVVPVFQGALLDRQSLGRAEEHTAMATDTIALPTPHLVVLHVIVVRVKGALVDTDLALYTPFRVSLHYKSGWQIGLH